MTSWDSCHYLEFFAGRTPVGRSLTVEMPNRLPFQIVGLGGLLFGDIVIAGFGNRKRRQSSPWRRLDPERRLALDWLNLRPLKAEQTAELLDDNKGPF